MMTNLMIAALLLPLLMVLISLKPLTAQLRKRRILDEPGERSSHTVATPRGAGLVIAPIVIVLWIGLSQDSSLSNPLGAPLIVGLAALILTAVSWADDVRGLSPVLRLLVHLACATVGSLAIPDDHLLFQGILVPWADRTVLVLVWAWFINLFNFMDGIDGISAVETLICAGGLALLSGWIGLPLPSLLLAALLTGAALGFLPWNWSPAKIFLGDSGSACIGFLLGWLLLEVACAGYWHVAVILPAYYLTDSGITLGRRLLRGERVWEAHRQHFYQRAAANWGHGRVSLLILGGGVLLVLAAAVALLVGWPTGLALGATATTATMYVLQRGGRASAH